MGICNRSIEQSVDEYRLKAPELQGKLNKKVADELAYAYCGEEA